MNTDTFFKLINPRQTILLTSRAEGKDNIIALDWHAPLSSVPPMYAVSIGKTKYSSELIKKSKVFVINFMPKDLEKEVLFCGRHSGKDFDKFKETGFEKEEAESIDCPRIKQALGYLECKMEKEIEIYSHFLFIAKVQKFELKRNDKRLFHLFGDEFTTTLE